MSGAPPPFYEPIAAVADFGSAFRANAAPGEDMAPPGTIVGRMPLADSQPIMRL